MTTEHARSRDRGSMAIVSALTALAIVAALAAALMPVLVDLAHRQQARSAADAAALAAVSGGRSAAVELATANGAVVVGYQVSGRSVTVWVRVGGEVALARATDAP